MLISHEDDRRYIQQWTIEYFHTSNIKWQRPHFKHIVTYWQYRSNFQRMHVFQKELIDSSPKHQYIYELKLKTTFVEEAWNKEKFRGGIIIIL